MFGLMKVVVEEVESSPEEEEEKSVALTRKRGRPAGSKNKPKAAGDAATAEATSPKAKRGHKKASEVEEADDDTDKTTSEIPEEEENVPSLSKASSPCKISSSVSDRDFAELQRSQPVGKTKSS